MIRVGIVGSAGYTGGELIRLLVYHPHVEIVFAHSSSNAGNHVSQVHTDLVGITDLKFTHELSDNIDVLFMCVGHGDAIKFIQSHAEYFSGAKFKIIDLSQDFRLVEKNKTYQLPIDSTAFIYGLPELQREAIRKAHYIANPGCFATCIQLGLYPLAKEKLIKSDVHVSAITGSTGAGQALSASSHFSWRNNNISVYKVFTHQHLKEIHQSLRQLQPNLTSHIQFIPFRGNFTRGIYATLYTEYNGSIEEAYQLYENYYSTHPFTHITKNNPDLKQVVNTNNSIIYLEKHENILFIVSITDNLLKGASGQAVQNMNLMFGIDETSGLKLKAAAF
ncbi:MAG: N-acetyl-gamma-glutamyl-phosphate reductase [Cytophagaceae bacterium]|nr:N-acetyl-gamma-glutamyl-phosphate reductase [Cytophagaceae bacterium]MDW8456807.1 N-acetyl-gamma-glutamyl-phosphate reductase [Cytophagaceae bacterium]